MTVVLGVDPSLTVSGCALVRWDPAAERSAPRWETWRARAVKPEAVSVASTRRRIRVMLREVLALVPPVVDMSVVEGPSMQSRHAGLADERSGLRWMLIDQLLARGPVVLVAPSTRAILAAGHGHASKPQVVTGARAIAPGAHVPDHNVGDAVALAAAGASVLGLAVAFTEKQLGAREKVAWPLETAA